MENSTLFKETCNDNKQRINIQKDTRERIAFFFLNRSNLELFFKNA